MASNILRHFAYDHLTTVSLRMISKPFSDLAQNYDESLPDCAEKAAGLRKLLEAKDCMVRAYLEKKED